MTGSMFFPMLSRTRNRLIRSTHSSVASALSSTRRKTLTMSWKPWARRLQATVLAKLGLTHLEVIEVGMQSQDADDDILQLLPPLRLDIGIVACMCSTTSPWAQI